MDHRGSVRIRYVSVKVDRRGSVRIRYVSVKVQLGSSITIFRLVLLQQAFRFVHTFSTKKKLLTHQTLRYVT